MEDESDIILRENTIGHDMSNTNPAKNRSELRSSENVSSSCITKYGDKSWLKKRRDWDYDKRNISVVICDTKMP